MLMDSRPFRRLKLVDLISQYRNNSVHQNAVQKEQTLLIEELAYRLEEAEESLDYALRGDNA